MSKSVLNIQIVSSPTREAGVNPAARIKDYMAGAEGLEPATAGFGNQCSAN